MEKRERYAAAKGRGAEAGGRRRERNTGVRTQLNNKIKEVS